MGCASSQQAAVSAHHVPPAPPGYHQTNTYQAQYKPAVVVVKVCKIISFQKQKENFLTIFFFLGPKIFKC